MCSGVTRVGDTRGGNRRSFSVAGPYTVWDLLSDDLRDQGCTESTFKQSLKTLFRAALVCRARKICLCRCARLYKFTFHHHHQQRDIVKPQVRVVKRATPGHTEVPAVRLMFDVQRTNEREQTIQKSRCTRWLRSIRRERDTRHGFKPW